MRIFCMWLLGSCIFVVIGIMSWQAKKPVKFWNLSQQIEVSDVKKYNHAVAKMWFVFGGIFAATGLSALAKNPAWMVIMILGGMACAIGLMVVYTRIEKKYRVM